MGPAVVGVLAIKLVALVASVAIGQIDRRVPQAPNRVGIENVRRLLVDDPPFWTSLRVTLTDTALSVPPRMAVALGLALILHVRMPDVGLFRTLFYLPSIMPDVASSIHWLWTINPDLGLPNAAPRRVEAAMVYDEAMVLRSLALMSRWSVGPRMMFPGGPQGIPRDLHETVGIDGGNAWQKSRDVTVPILKW